MTRKSKSKAQLDLWIEDFNLVSIGTPTSSATNDREFQVEIETFHQQVLPRRPKIEL